MKIALFFLLAITQLATSGCVVMNYLDHIDFSDYEMGVHSGNGSGGHSH